MKTHYRLTSRLDGAFPIYVIHNWMRLLLLNLNMISLGRHFEAKDGTLESVNTIEKTVVGTKKVRPLLICRKTHLREEIRSHFHNMPIAFFENLN